MFLDLSLLLALFVLTWLARAMALNRRWPQAILVPITTVAALLVLAHVGYLATSRGLSPLLRSGSGFSRIESAPGHAQLVVSKRRGGDFVVDYEYLGRRKVAETSLKREWVVINDPSFPVQLSDSAGIVVRYKADPGGYRWTANYTMTTSSAISAVDVRFVLLDVWGDRLETLSDASVVDVSGPSSKRQSAEWSLYPENEMASYFVSIAYVARVRMQDGRIYAAHLDSILEEIRKFSAKFEPKGLEPGRGAPRGSSRQAS
jgi:hypothetical protein